MLPPSAEDLRSQISDEPPGADRIKKLWLTLAEAAGGCSKTVAVRRRVRCLTCRGRGTAKSIVGASSCRACDGRGAIQRRSRSLILVLRCVSCDGTGRQRAACPDCHGNGLRDVQENLQVTVPAGVEEGQLIRLPSKGDESTDIGAAGCQLLAVAVEPDPRFRRRGADLFTQVEVDAALARTGGHVLVPTLEGDRPIPVPPGIRSGAEVILHGYGAVRLGEQAVPISSSRPDPYRSLDIGMHRGDQTITFVLKDEGALRKAGGVAPSLGAPPHRTAISVILTVLVAAAATLLFSR